MARGQAPLPSTAGEKIIAGCSSHRAEVVIDGLPGLFGQLEPNRATGLPLPDGCPVECIAMRSDIGHSQADDIASAQFAVDGDIEQRQVAFLFGELEPRPNGPYMLWLKRRLLADELALVPRPMLREVSRVVTFVSMIVLRSF